MHHLCPRFQDSIPKITFIFSRQYSWLCCCDTGIAIIIIIIIFILHHLPLFFNNSGSLPLSVATRLVRIITVPTFKEMETTSGWNFNVS